MLEAMLTDARFTNVSITSKADSDKFIRDWDDDRDLSDYIVAATIESVKLIPEYTPSIRFSPDSCRYSVPDGTADLFDR